MLTSSFLLTAAIESEMRHQKAALSKQREDYIKKTNILKKELETLKDQRNELRGDSKRSPSPDTKRFLKENTKLQVWMLYQMQCDKHIFCKFSIQSACVYDMLYFLIPKTYRFFLHQLELFKKYNRLFAEFYSIDANSTFVSRA